MDYLEELSEKLGGKIKIQDIFNSNFKEKGFRRLIIKNYKGRKVEICEYGDIFDTNIKIETDFKFAFAINNNIEKIGYLIKKKLRSKISLTKSLFPKQITIPY